MPVTIELLNEKYGKEDKAWHFKLFPTWLAKKGLSSTIIAAALKRALSDYSEETLPEKHHDFDQAVLAIAMKMKDISDEATVKLLEEQLNDGYKQYEADWNSLSKMKKIWEVVRGRA